jgi:hypothetical protein
MKYGAFPKRTAAAIAVLMVVTPMAAWACKPSELAVEAAILRAALYGSSANAMNQWDTTL